MRLKVLAAVMTLMALGVAPGAQAVDPANFDFNGYALVPTSVGGVLTLRSVLTNNGVVPTPIALDFANNQYTLVVTGTLASVVGISQNYNLASVQIWEDPISTGTAADYAVPATFTDGTMILGGVFDGNLVRNRISATLGSYLGKINFGSGSRLAGLPSPNSWPFGGGWSRTISGIPSGYQENWDGKIDLTTIAVQPEKWGSVKGLFR